MDGWEGGFRAVRLGMRWFGIGCLAGWLGICVYAGMMVRDAFGGDYCT